MMPDPADLPGAPPQNVQPQPVPQTYKLHQVETGNGKHLIAIDFSSVNGRWVAFFDPDSADDLADKIKANAREARSGLTIARSIPPASGR